MTLRVLTLNLWNNSGDYARRRELIRGWIERLDPDVIGFQEALQGDALDQVPELVGGLGYHCDFAAAAEFWMDGTMRYGNALASRWPIRDREEIGLPHDGAGETRVALSVTIDAPFGELSFTVTHLNWRLDHGFVRERQVVAVCALANRRAPAGYPDAFPPVITGDFNARPDSTEIRYVTGLQSLDGGSVHFHDAWAVAGDGGPGHTFHTRNPHAAQMIEPDRRIDYIFVGHPGRGGIGDVEMCRIVCDEPAPDGVWPSDHAGVYAELRTEAR